MSSEDNLDKQLELNDSSSAELEGPRRGPRGRIGKPGPRMESCIITLKSEHPEYYIKNEADVVICRGHTSFPAIWLPKIDSNASFDCEYLTVNKTKSRIKIINLSDSRLTIKHHPDDCFCDDQDVYPLKMGKYIIAYGVDNCWYLSK